MSGSLEKSGLWRDKKGEAGVSLVELMVVIVIIIITSTAAISLGVNYLPTYRLKSAATQLTAHLRLAQLRATTRSLEYRVNFDAGNNTYQIERGNRFSSSTVWVAEDAENPNKLGVSPLGFPDRINLTAAPAAVTFRTNGTNRDDNTITISLRNEKNRSESLSISPTGRVKIN